MNVLVGTDFSDQSKAAVRWGAFLADQLGSKLILTHVVDLAAGDNAWRVLVETPEEIEESALVDARERLETFFDETVSTPPPDVEFRAVLGTPVDELLAEADHTEGVVMVVGTRGASRLKEIFLGNTARRLVRRSPHPVVLVPSDAEVSQPERIIVGVDFSQPSRQALRRAAMAARTYGATVHAIYGYVLPEVSTVEGAMLTDMEQYDELIEEKRQALEKMIKEEGADDVVDEVSALQLPPEHAVVQTAKDENAQFIFVGSHGREGFKRFFLGNTAERVMRKSPIPVFVAPGIEEEESEE